MAEIRAAMPRPIIVSPLISLRFEIAGPSSPNRVKTA